MKFLRQRFGLFGGKKRARATAEGSAASVGSASVAATMDSREGLLARVLRKGVVSEAKEDEDDLSDDEMSVLPPGEGSRGLRAGEDVGMDVDGESSELMQLELCEEDEPAIVPFEEVILEWYPLRGVRLGVSWLPRVAQKEGDLPRLLFCNALHLTVRSSRHG